jgi:hypothetical protein
MLILTTRRWVYLGNGNTERVGTVLRGIWLEYWPKAHDPDWILRTCDLVDFMTPFIPNCVAEFLALLLRILKFSVEWLVLLLPILKFSVEWLVLLLRILKLHIPGGFLYIISDTWPVFPSVSPNKMPE